MKFVRPRDEQLFSRVFFVCVTSDTQAEHGGGVGQVIDPLPDMVLSVLNIKIDVTLY